MTDVEFARRCAGGSQQALNEFISKYSRLIYNYIHSVLRQNNPQLADQDNLSDIFQGIFLSLSENDFKRLKTFRGKNGCSLASWLRQVTINYTLDYLRRFRPQVYLDEEDDEGFSLKDILCDNSESAADKVQSQEKFGQLRECMDRLGMDDKYFIEFHIYRGISLELMRRLFGVSRGAIDMRKQRLVNRLRECFEEKGFFVSP